MKRLLVTLSAIAALSLPAIAQAHDWAGSTYDWQGPYVGLQGGYGWGDSTGGLVVSGIPVPYHPHPDGVLGGAHAGFDWQWGHFVLGLEGDLSGADITGSDSKTSPPFTVKSQNNLDASLRGKAGFAIDRVLIYGTGGVAFGQVKTEYSCPGCYHPPPPFGGYPFQTTNGVRVGWSAGAGVEVAVSPKWSTAVEYRYTDLGDKGFVGVYTPAADSGNKFSFNAVTLGVSYHFLPPRRPGPPPAPIVPAMAPEPVPPAPVPSVPAMAAPAAHAFVVYFEDGHRNLTPQATAVLHEAARAFDARGYARIEITGYTDLAGAAARHNELSQRRGVAVAEYLAHHGVPRQAIHLMWRDQSHPADEEIGGPGSGRVEILMP